MSSLQLRYQADYESLVSYREHLITQLESINNQIKSLLKEARQEKIIIQNWVIWYNAAKDWQAQVRGFFRMRQVCQEGYAMGERPRGLCRINISEWAQA